MVMNMVYRFLFGSTHPFMTFIEFLLNYTSWAILFVICTRFISCNGIRRTNVWNSLIFPSCIYPTIIISCFKILVAINDGAPPVGSGTSTNYSSRHTNAGVSEK